jgi:hexosaminidase
VNRAPRDHAAAAPFRILAGVRAAVATLALLLPAPALAAAPAVVPPVREWHAARGTFTLAASARVVGGGGEGGRLARALRLETAKRAGPGDIVLASPRRPVPAEGYVLRIGRTIRIEASTTSGWFYGGRTLKQLAKRPMARGTIRDRPAYPERGLMIDVGRRFYPRAWLAARIRQLAALKLNRLHLHLSDDQGFRVASDAHPEIVSEEHLTKADVRALQRVARRNHVTLVPEIDMPGHMTAALATHPELQLADVAGNREAGKLDVTLPEARRFVAELLADQLALWKTPFWHAGADEYLGAFATDADYARFPQLAAYARDKHGPDATGHDAVQDFVNEIGARVRAAGKRLRVWSDGIHADGVVPLFGGAVVEWWENRVSPTPAALSAAGHDVLNVGWWPLYYVNGGPLGGLRSTEADFERDFVPWHFEGPYTPRWAGGPPAIETLDPADPHLLGATLAVWNDDPANAGGAPGTLEHGIAPRLRILAGKTWTAMTAAVGK